MDKLLIIGSGGAGKSTLARTLGRRLGLPVIHLDQWLATLPRTSVGAPG